MPAALRRKRSRIVTALMLAASLGACACTHEAAAPLPHPLVVVGIDGLEWKLSIDLAKEGRLPELSRLVREGSAVRTATLAPTISPPIWTSMATGVIPDRHGIHGFVRPAR